MPPLFPIIHTNIFIILSLLFCCVSCLITLFFTVPLQIKQAKVKNGLAKLRKQLLALGVTLFFTQIIALYFLVIICLKYVGSGHFISTISQVLVFLHSTSMLFVAYIAHEIYTQQYTKEHIEDSNRNAIFNKN